MRYTPPVKATLRRSKNLGGLAYYASSDRAAASKEWNKDENLNCAQCGVYVRSENVRQYTFEKCGSVICWNCQEK